jgi:hypothetical protein
LLAARSLIIYILYMPQPLLQCPFCPKTSSRGTGLASHIRGSHPKQYTTWTKDRKSGGAPVAAKSAPAESGFGEAIALLERQRHAIEAALTALREIGDIGAQSATPVATKGASRKKRKGGMSPEGKARLIAALKKHWAERKAAAGAPAKKSGRGPGRPKKA